MFGTPTAFPATEMLLKVLSSALIAGALAGFVAGVLQLVFVQPVLLHAELYESGQLVHFGDGPSAAAHQHVAAFGLARDGMSLLFSVLLFAGYAMLLLPAILMAADWHDQPVTPAAGLIWGVAGFVVVNLAPAFSMAPEVPGVAAADVGARQIWWVSTVVMAAGALWLIAFVRRPVFLALAVALLLAPHLYGAPEPEAFFGTVPPEIAAQFAARALGVNLASWVTLGVLVAFLWSTARETLRAT